MCLKGVVQEGGVFTVVVNKLSMLKGFSKETYPFKGFLSFFKGLF